MIELQYFTDIELLALMIAAESDNQPIAGQVAVANTVIERLQRRRQYYGYTLRSIMLMPFQYSTFNSNHWRRFTHRIPAYILLAQLAMNGHLRTFVDGATHYCHKDLLPKPTWTKPEYSLYLGTIGVHEFYREY